MESGPRHKDLILMVGRLLLRLRHRATTISISRRSCAARPTDLCTNSDRQKGPGAPRRGRCFCNYLHCFVIFKILIINDKLSN
jgi:hypothetical protein